MTNYVSVSIGIPAYNEEDNIGHLLRSILKQEEKDFYIKEIIVISDGSIDKTVQKARQVNDKRIMVFDDMKRRGKNRRVIEFFKMAKGDISVQLDADISMKDKTAIAKLIRPMQLDNSVAIVFGMCKPLSPKNFVEKLTYFGFEVWDDARHSTRDKTDKHFSMGGIRAFSREFRRKFKFPKDIGSGEDAYSYYYSKAHGFRVAYAEDAVIYIRLAASIRDYIKQMARNLHSSKKVFKHFDGQIAETSESISTKVMMKSFLKKSLKTSPHISLGFVALHIFPKVYALFFKSTGLWDMASSTKKLN